MRQELIVTLINHFIKDLSESYKPFTDTNDKIKITGVLIEYLKGVYNSYPQNEYFETELFDEDEFIEKNLLEPYRDKMIPFVKAQLTYYFEKDEFKKERLFKKLKIKEPILNEEEYTDYIIRLFVLLGKIKKGFYLMPVGSAGITQNEVKELTESPEELEKQGLKGNKLGFSRARQALMYYYVLKLLGFDIRSDNSTLAALSRFGHALTCLPYSSMQNSDLYKLMLKAPYVKPDKLLLKDLEFVKRQFEDIDHQEGIALVQKEIDSINKSR